MAKRRECIRMLVAMSYMMSMMAVGQVETLSCPVAMTRDSGRLGAIVVTWPDDPLTNRTCDPESGSEFGIGMISVSCTNDDNLMDTCRFKVTIRDTGRPSFTTCPVSAINENTDPETSTSSCPRCIVSAQDNGPMGATVNCDRLSLSSFNIGNTTVTCTAIDAAGNTATCAFQVNVKDNQAPVFNMCPEDTIRKTINIAGSQFPSFSVNVMWPEPKATDNAGTFTLSSSHQSGEKFDLGTTHVIYSATDSYGNTNPDGCSFDIQIVVQASADRIFAESFTERNIDSCLSLKWPMSPDNQDREYKISYWKEEGGKSSQLQKVTYSPSSANTLTTYEGPHEICSLSPGELYTVKVGGGTVQRWTAPIVPGDVVKVVPGTLSSSSVELSWTPITLRNVEQYRVTLSNGRDLGYYTKTTNRITVDSLRPKTIYSAIVTAVVGSGSMRTESNFPSERFTTGVLQGSDLTAFNYTESTIEVAWVSSSSLTSNKDPNMLFIEPKGAAKNYLTVPGPGNPATALFEGLKPNTEYHIRLISNLGLSLSTTQKTRPSPVGNFRATTVLENSITVEWNSPTEGDIDSYEIYISPGSKSEPTAVSTTSYTFSKLTPKTEYFIKIVSIFEGVKSVPKTLMVTAGVTTAAPPPKLNIIAIAVGAALGALSLCLMIAIVVTCIKYRRQKKLHTGVYERNLPSIPLSAISQPASSYTSRVPMDQPYVNTRSLADRFSNSLFRGRRQGAQGRDPPTMPNPAGSEYAVPDING